MTSFDTAVSTCAGRSGLTTHALVPAARPSRSLPSRDSVVGMMMGVNFQFLGVVGAAADFAPLSHVAWGDTRACPMARLTATA